jgi:hypothetical protein
MAGTPDRKGENPMATEKDLACPTCLVMWNEIERAASVAIAELAPKEKRPAAHVWGSVLAQAISELLSQGIPPNQILCLSIQKAREGLDPTDEQQRKTLTYLQGWLAT